MTTTKTAAARYKKAATEINIIMCYALRHHEWQIRINFVSFVYVLVCLVRNLLKMRQKMHHQLYIYTSAFSERLSAGRPLVEQNISTGYEMR